MCYWLYQDVVYKNKEDTCICTYEYTSLCVCWTFTLIFMRGSDVDVQIPQLSEYFQNQKVLHLHFLYIFYSVFNTQESDSSCAIESAELNNSCFLTYQLFHQLQPLLSYFSNHLKLYDCFLFFVFCITATGYLLFLLIFNTVCDFCFSLELKSY